MQSSNMPNTPKTRSRLPQKKRNVPDWFYAQKSVSIAFDAMQLQDRFEEVAEMFKLGLDEDLVLFLKDWMPTMKWSVQSLVSNGDDIYMDAQILLLTYEMNGIEYTHYAIRKQ